MEEQEEVYEYTRKGSVYVTPSLELAYKRATSGGIYVIQNEQTEEP